MATDEETDVLIIGAGPGGAGNALKLAKAGMRVICLEQGPWVKPTDHPHYHDEWELEKQRGWAYDPNVRQLPEDYPVTGTTTPYMMNNVGGSTVHYAGHWPRYKPVDFRKGTEHGLEGTIDWPISYEDLAPFYDENDEIYGISGRIGDPSYPDRKQAVRDPEVLPGQARPEVRQGLEGPRLALVAVRQRGHHRPAREPRGGPGDGQRALRQPDGLAVDPGERALALCHPVRGRPADDGPRRDDQRRERQGDRRDVHRPQHR
jgi:choline dehydrogenase-like flavoprotein